MPIFDPAQAFQAGQAMGSGASSLPSFFSSLTDRLKSHLDSRNKIQADIGSQLAVKSALAPGELAQDKELAKYKQDLENQGPGADLQRAKAGFLERIGVGGSAGQSPDEVAQALSEGGKDPEDFEITPQERNVMGIPITKYTAKLKPMVDQKTDAQIKALRTQANGLTRNLELMSKNVRDYMSPTNFGASRIPGAGAYLKGKAAFGTDSASQSATEFATFKAETDKVFQAFRSDVTGAAAGLRELGWLAPDFPEANDPPKLYTRKAIEALKRIKEGEQLLLDSASQRGQRTSGYRKGGPKVAIPGKNRSTGELFNLDPSEFNFDEYDFVFPGEEE